MAEGVMIHYDGNVLTNGYKRKTKTTIHWVVLTLGGGCGAAGALIKMIQKGFLLQSIHGKLGRCDFMSKLIINEQLSNYKHVNPITYLSNKQKMCFP